MEYRVPLAYNTYGNDEFAAAESVLRGGYLTQGKHVGTFERMLAESIGAKYAILVNSGSSANLVAIEAAIYCSRLAPSVIGREITPGDEVIVPGLNWPSTLKPLLNHGLIPVFCDVESRTLNASVRTVEAVRSERTRMVIAIPVLGNPDGLDELRTYCFKNGLVLIEDACESLGAVTVKGRHVGTLGLCSALSFYFSHHISTIEGGAIVTDSDEIADLCFSLRSHGWTRHLKVDRFAFEANTAGIDQRFCFALPGYNVRPTEIAAAIGKVQLARLPEMLAARRRIARNRNAALAGAGDRVVMPGAEIGDRHSWMITPLLFKDGAYRRRARDYFERIGIETRPIIAGNVLRHPVTRLLGLKPDQPQLPVCDAIFERGLMIGLSPLSDAETEAFVCTALRDVLELAEC